MTAPASLAPMPDAAGFFGPYGGQLVPPHLKQAMDDINAAYAQITQREDFQQELAQLFADYVGRPSPIFHAKRLSAQLICCMICSRPSRLSLVAKRTLMPSCCSAWKKRLAASIFMRSRSGMSPYWS